LSGGHLTQDMIGGVEFDRGQQVTAYFCTRSAFRSSAFARRVAAFCMVGLAMNSAIWSASCTPPPTTAKSPKSSKSPEKIPANASERAPRMPVVVCSPLWPTATSSAMACATRLQSSLPVAGPFTTGRCQFASTEVLDDAYGAPAHSANPTFPGSSRCNVTTPASGFATSSL
jgi:hypothetical protein